MRFFVVVAVVSGLIGCSSGSSNTLGPAAAQDGGTEGGDAATPADICFACAGPTFQPGGACVQPITACKGDAECDRWNTCYETCFKENPVPSCFAGCKDAHPSAASLDSAVIRCVCGACAAPCAVACQ
jgi:hypothetical protein